MDTYGLVGYPLGHSFSKQYFQKKFKKEKINAVFANFEISTIDQFPEILKENANLKGLSVTIPHKETIIPLLDSLDESAAEVGAVNSVKIIHQNGTTLTKGYNTDVYGFQTSLSHFISKSVKNALVLGTGGAAKAVSQALKKMNINFQLVSRTAKEGQLTYGDLDFDIMENTELIVNTTPLGTYPDILSSPKLPYQYLSAQHYLFDLVYNPAETLLLKRSREYGSSIQNGLEMLELQAERSWEIWNEQTLSDLKLRKLRNS